MVRGKGTSEELAVMVTGSTDIRLVTSAHDDLRLNFAALYALQKVFKFIICGRK
jgi:hypothetical protein